MKGTHEFLSRLRKGLDNWVDNKRLLSYNSIIPACRAGVVKLVDAEYSKSSDPCGHVGSIPTSGTRKIKGFVPRKAGLPLFSWAL